MSNLKFIYKHKVSSVTFLSGVNADEMIKLRSVEIESRSAGWINCPITGNIKTYNYQYIRIDIKNIQRKCILRLIKMILSMCNNIIYLGL